LQARPWFWFRFFFFTQCPVGRPWVSCFFEMFSGRAAVFFDTQPPPPFVQWYLWEFCQGRRQPRCSLVRLFFSWLTSPSAIFFSSFFFCSSTEKSLFPLVPSDRAAPPSFCPRPYVCFFFLIPEYPHRLFRALPRLVCSPPVRRVCHTCFCALVAIPPLCQCVPFPQNEFLRPVAACLNFFFAHRGAPRGLLGWAPPVSPGFSSADWFFPVFAMR